MLSELMEIVRQAACAAGEEVERLAKAGFTTDYKGVRNGERDPVTTADLAANQILKSRLEAALPEAGWLSEETQDDLARLAKPRVWVVDPIDGTKEFVKRIPEYAVSVALVEGGRPVAAAVYNPATGDSFYAARGQGCWRNGRRVSARTECFAPMRVLISRSSAKREDFAVSAVKADIVPVGSIAYKLALVAAGEADATVSLSPKNEWDIAAGVLLVEEAGGVVTDKTGHTFEFNRPHTLVDGVVAASPAAYAAAQAMVMGGR